MIKKRILVKRPFYYFQPTVPWLQKELLVAGWKATDYRVVNTALPTVVEAAPGWRALAQCTPRRRLRHATYYIGLLPTPDAPYTNIMSRDWLFFMFVAKNLWRYHPPRQATSGGPGNSQYVFSAVIKVILYQSTINTRNWYECFAIAVFGQTGLSGLF